MAKLSTHLRAITIFTQRKPSCGNPLPYLYWQNKLLNYKWYLTFWENQLLSTWQIQVYSLWRLQRDYYLTSDGRHVSDRWALTDLNCCDPDKFNNVCKHGLLQSAWGQSACVHRAPLEGPHLNRDHKTHVYQTPICFINSPQIRTCEAFYMMYSFARAYLQIYNSIWIQFISWFRINFNEIISHSGSAFAFTRW